MAPVFVSSTAQLVFNIHNKSQKQDCHPYIISTKCPPLIVNLITPHRTETRRDGIVCVKCVISRRICIPLYFRNKIGKPFKIKNTLPNCDRRPHFCIPVRQTFQYKTKITADTKLNLPFHHSEMLVLSVPDKNDYGHQICLQLQSQITDMSVWDKNNSTSIHMSDKRKNRPWRRADLEKLTVIQLDHKLPTCCQTLRSVSCLQEPTPCFLCLSLEWQEV
jgi:hypothetical protein